MKTPICSLNSRIFCRLGLKPINWPSYMKKRQSHVIVNICISITHFISILKILSIAFYRKERNTWLLILEVNIDIQLLVFSFLVNWIKRSLECFVLYKFPKPSCLTLVNVFHLIVDFSHIASLILPNPDEQQVCLMDSQNVYLKASFNGYN